MGVAVDPATAEQSSHVFQFHQPEKRELKGLGDVEVFVLEKRRENGAAATTLSRGAKNE